MIESTGTIGKILYDRADKNPNDIGFKTKVDGKWVERTWRHIADRAEAIAAGLLSVGEFGNLDAIGILGETSEHWLTCDLAAIGANFQTVPIYASLKPEEVGYILQDTKIKAVIVDNADQLEKVRKARSGFTFFDKEYLADSIVLEHIVVIDPSGIEPADDWESLDQLEERGRERLDDFRDEALRRRSTSKPDDVITYTYTSGTTGPPKATIQTHTNHLSMVEMVRESGIFIPDELRPTGMFLFLPLAHSFGRLVEWLAVAKNVPIIISSVPTLIDDITETRPGFVPAAPRVFEKMRAKIETALSAAPLPRRILGFSALVIGAKTAPYRMKGEPLPLTLKLRYNAMDKLVLSKIRERLGFDRADVLISGSAPLDDDVYEFFLAIGLNLYEAYGLTETCPGLAINRPGKIRTGTVGQVLHNVEIKIADDDEILAKGPNIVSGYLNRPEATAEAFNGDGWFHTGDTGSIDDEGFLRITGRKKELLKTSGGKYVAPAKIEGKLKLYSIVNEAVLVGDRRNYCIALLSLDPEEFPIWAERKGIPADPTNEVVSKALDRWLEIVNEDLASFETVKYWRLIDPPTIENGLMTASLKVKRTLVLEKYSDLIDEVYQQGRSHKKS